MEMNWHSWKLGECMATVPTASAEKVTRDGLEWARDHC